MTCDRFHLVGTVGVALAVLLGCPVFAQGTDPHNLLAEAVRLAWLRVWTRAEPLYAEAREAFLRNGDKRKALYAEVSRLRGRLPTLPVPEVSERLSLYLDDPIVQSDERVRCVYSISSRRALVLVQESAETVATVHRDRLCRRRRRH
jgi:hypothetical protein